MLQNEGLNCACQLLQIYSCNDVIRKLLHNIIYALLPAMLLQIRNHHIGNAVLIQPFLNIRNGKQLILHHGNQLSNQPLPVACNNIRPHPYRPFYPQWIAEQGADSKRVRKASYRCCTEQREQQSSNEIVLKRKCRQYAHSG
ncbi:hypothetical protein D3C78_1326520 [compost metagenome]